MASHASIIHSKQQTMCKLEQVCWQLGTSLLTACNKLVHIINKSISGYVRMAWDSLLMTILFHVFMTCSMLIVKTCYTQACNKPDFHRLVVTWCNWQAFCNALTSSNKLVKLTTCKKLVMFLAVYIMCNCFMWTPLISNFYIQNTNKVAGILFMFETIQKCCSHVLSDQKHFNTVQLSKTLLLVF